MKRSSSATHLFFALCGSFMLFVASCAVVQPLGVERQVNEVDGGLYDLSATDQASVAKGPASEDASHAPEYDMSYSGCDLGSVKVNEVSTAGAGGATDEYVELYNPCAASLSLAGARITYRAATSGGDNYTLATFAAQHVIPAHGYFLVANGNFAGSADVKPFGTSAGLAATGGGVALEDVSGTVIDSVGWGTASNAFVEDHPVGAPASAQSASRHIDGVDTNDNLADFILATRTPGGAN